MYMVQQTERRGEIGPGATIVECTSGNTGMGLALFAAGRGYKTLFTIADKKSKEKIDMLRAMGAEVIVCPTDVPPDDPRGYIQVARQLARDIPGAFLCNQYDNPDNTLAHYASTGPEIWNDTGRTPPTRPRKASRRDCPMRWWSCRSVWKTSKTWTGRSRHLTRGVCGRKPPH